MTFDCSVTVALESRSLVIKGSGSIKRKKDTKGRIKARSNGHDS